MISEEERNLIASVDSWKMREHDRILAEEIGDRFLGTEGDRKSIDYVKKQFKSWGLEVVLDPVETLTFEYRSARFSVGSPMLRDIDCKAAYFSKPSAAAGVEGELVHVGSGSEKEMKSVNLKGKIAVATATQGDPMFWIGFHITRAAQLGAVGLVICHTSPIAFTPSASLGLWDQIPCITIGCTTPCPCCIRWAVADLLPALQLTAQLNQEKGTTSEVC